MDANDIALYLKENPKFFEDYADVVAEIFVPHPHGGHAIPIAERQIVTLAGEEQRAREPAARADPLRQRERPDQREAPPLDARADRGAGSRDHARRALSQPEGGLRGPAGREPALGQGARAVVSARARGNEPRSCTNTPTGSAPRIAARARRSNRATGSTPARPAIRSRSCRCAPTYTFGLLGLGERGRRALPSPEWARMYLTRLAELASVATARYLPRA